MTKFLTLIFISCAIFAQEAQNKETENQTDQKTETPIEEVRITSDTLDFHNQEKKRMAIFEKNVIVTRGSMTMNADKMTCHLTPNNEIHLIIAEGNVVIIDGKMKATSQKAAYQPEDKKFILIRQPMIFQEESKIEARRITIYQETNEFHFDEPIVHTTVEKDEQTK